MIKNNVHSIEEDDAKFHEFYFLLLNWIHIKNCGKEIGDYLKEYGYATIAVYGLKEIGRELIFELRKAGIDVMCAIDKDANTEDRSVMVVKPSEDIPKVDLVIVTAIYYYDEIKEQLEKKVNCPILSFDDLVWDIVRKEQIS